MLFGSHARGEVGSGSDVDLAILVRGLDPGEKNAALHLVKAGRLPPADAHVFSKLMKYREEADYNPSHPFSSEDLEAMAQEARRLADRVTGLLDDGGWLVDD